MNRVVLDASALLALLQGEPGAVRVREVLMHSECCINTVNLSEAAGKLFERLQDMEQVRELLSIPGLDISDVTEGEALEAAALLPSCKAMGLSLGDRMCLASGICKKALVLTADKAWLKLESSLKIEAIR